MRKRKEPPLGRARAVRTIPISAAEPVRGRRPPADLDPGLADLATNLLPPVTDPQPSTWLSWSVRDQDDEHIPSIWNTPVVDGVEADGEGRGFPEFTPDLAPITEADVTTAASAGWPYDPTAPERAPSFLRQVSGIFQSESQSETIALAAAPAMPMRPPAPGPSFPDLPSFDPPGIADSIALHPSMAHPSTGHPSTAPPSAPRPAPPAAWSDAPAFAPPPPVDARMTSSPPAEPTFPATEPPASAAAAPVDEVVAPPVDEIDAADFVARLERGASMTMTEAQLLSLAQRAVRRLAPEGSGRWLTTQLDETLTLRLTVGDDAHPGCGITESRMCPAIVTGQVQRFDDSHELDACPHLLAADAPQCAATCVPVAHPGPLQGVLFISAPARRVDDATGELLARTVDVITARLAEIRGIGG